jgi:hypothetical protein
MTIKTLNDIEKKKEEFISGAKADQILKLAPELKENRILKGFRIPAKMAEDLKILSAKSGKDQSTLVQEALKLLFSKYYE